MTGKFILSAEEIRPDLAPGHGACFATDQVTVQGLGVNFMYREPPDREVDSGWRFFSGQETQHYIDDLANTSVYDVNTIANYSPDIVPLLDAAYGTAFERGPNGAWQPAPFPGEPTEARAAATPVSDRPPGGARSPYDYPLVSGQYQMTDDWMIHLPGEFRRRFENGSLVIWRPGITLWTTVWKGGGRSQAERTARWKKYMSHEAFDVTDEMAHGVVRFAYRLDERRPRGLVDHVVRWFRRKTKPDLREARVPAFYGFVIGRSGDVQMGIYFDDEADLGVAMSLWRGVEERSAD